MNRHTDRWMDRQNEYGIQPVPTGCLCYMLQSDTA